MPHQYRTIWISDLHLGTRAANASALLDFLSRHEAKRYYLVGDIVDGWALRRSWYWPSSHNDVLRTLLQRADRSEVIYVPGNHDEAARQFQGLRLGGITIETDAVHTTADGRRFLVLHGDEFDGVVRHARWVSKLGGWAYEQLLTLSRCVNRVRWWMDLPYWSLAAATKKKSKRAVQYIADFEQAVATRAHERDVDGIVCGHIHAPALRRVRDIAYANAGDWVEHCTALVETMDGSLSVRRWKDRGAQNSTVPPEAAPTAGDGTSQNLPSPPTPRCPEKPSPAQRPIHAVSPPWCRLKNTAKPAGERRSIFSETCNFRSHSNSVS